MRCLHHGIVMVILLAYPVALWSQLSLLDSLLQQLSIVEQRPSDTAKVQYWNQLSAAYRLYANDSLHAIEYARKALTLARQLSYSAGKALAQHNMGLAYFQQARYDEALHAHLQALELRKQAGDKQGTARSLNGIGLIYQYQGRYDKALEMYFEALPIHEEIQDTTGLGVVHDNIGAVYRLQGQRYFSPDIAAFLFDELVGKKKSTALDPLMMLSKREIEVMHYIAQEMTNQEIADKLFISSRTVESHRQNILDKIGARNTAGIVKFALEHRLHEFLDNR